MSMKARLWKEGRRVYEEEGIAVETDGQTVTVTDDDGEQEFGADEWDELTVSV